MNGQIECATIGTVATEPELRETNAGKRYMRFSLAVGRGEETTWASVAIFGSAAEELQGRLTKGGRVYLEGQIRLSQWTASDGTPKSGLSIAAFRASIVGAIGRNRPRKASDEETAEPAAPRRDDRRDYQRPPARTGRQPSGDDPIPF